MARGKGKPLSKTAKETQTIVVDEPYRMEESDPERFSAFAYLVVNAGFWIFCLINLFVAQWFMGEATGLYFFFGVMAVGFTAACLLSYLHDRFFEDDRPEIESP